MRAVASIFVSFLSTRFVPFPVGVVLSGHHRYMHAMSDLTKADLDRAVSDLRRDLQVEWRGEIITQTRWLAGLFVAGFIGQFFATMAGVYAIFNLVGFVPK